MTWLPVRAESGSERDTVFGLMPDVDEPLYDILSVADQISDPWLLECCHLRQSQMMGARAALAGVDASLLADLENWRASALFSNRQRAALSYAEQYHLDHHVISDEQKDRLSRYLAPREFVNFVWALHAYEAYARVLALLDIAPDPNPAAKPQHLALKFYFWSSNRPTVALGKLAADAPHDPNRLTSFHYDDEGRYIVHSST